MPASERRTAQVLEDFASCVPTKRERETANAKCIFCGGKANRKDKAFSLRLVPEQALPDETMTKRQYPDPFSDIPDATEDGAVIDVLYTDENTPFVFLGLDGVHTWKPTKRDAKRTADIGRDAFGAAIDALRDAERKIERLMLSRRHIREQIMPEADAQQSGLERNAFLAGADAVLGLFEKR